jgi:hypothetical protein
MVALMRLRDEAGRFGAFDIVLVCLMLFLLFGISLSIA